MLRFRWRAFHCLAIKLSALIAVEVRQAIAILLSRPLLFPSISLWLQAILIYAAQIVHEYNQFDDHDMQLLHLRPAAVNELVESICNREHQLLAFAVRLYPNIVKCGFSAAWLSGRQPFSVFRTAAIS